MTVVLEKKTNSFHWLKTQSYLTTNAILLKLEKFLNLNHA